MKRKNKLTGKKAQNKKAQVTIFIIIAVILVAAILLFFVFRKNIITDTSVIPAVSVDKQVQPVYDIIKSCLEEKTLQGLELLRLQGGYIYLPNDVEKIKVQTDEGEKEIPIWLSEETIAVPSLDFMKSQLEKYLAEEVPKCTDFSDLKSRGFDISQTSPEFSVDFLDYILITMAYPTYINYKEQSYEFSDFSNKVNVNIPQIHDIAISLVTYELGYNYLEYHSNSLISLYSYAGGAKRAEDLPPFHFTDTNLDCSFVTWNNNEVKSNLQSIFQENYPYIKMDKTNFEKVKAGDAISQGVYDSFIYDYFPEMKNIYIDFIYNPNYGMNLKINPASLIPDRTSRSGIPFLPTFCTFDYDFEYTFSAPVLAKIKDTDSSNIKNGKLAEKGLVFYFPMKVYVCDNLKRRCGEKINYELDMEQVESVTGLKFYDCLDIDRETTINVRDDSNVPLSNVQITHYCDGFANDCWLGYTDENGNAMISLPKCTNSTLELIKQGYGTIKQEIKSSYALPKKRNFNADVKLIKASKFMAAYDMTNGFTQPACGKTPLTLLSEAIYTPTVKDEILINFGYNLLPLSYPTSKIVEFASGNYNINTVVNSEVVIQPSSYDGTIVSFNQDDKNQPYRGKWMMGASSYNIDVLPQDVIGKTKATFYAFVEHLSSEDLSVKTFENPVLQSDGKLQGKIQVDSNCDGITEDKEVIILESQYNQFIKPKFS